MTRVIEPERNNRSCFIITYNHYLPSRYLKLQTLENGETGHLEFNGDGDRMNPMYNVINVKKGEQQAVVGRYSAALVSLTF